MKETECSSYGLQLHCAYLTGRIRFYLECIQKQRLDLETIIQSDLKREEQNAEYYYGKKPD